MSEQRMRLVVGTGGFAAWWSDDLGETWTRPYAEHGIYPEARVWAIASDRRAPQRVFVGTDVGVHVFHASDNHWEKLASPLDAQPVWSLVQSPHDPDVFLAGTQYPATLYRSNDSCRTWTRLPTAFAERCKYVGWPRVTQIAFDPHDAQVIWAGVEIDGVYRSGDGGRTWEKRVAGMVSEDLHGLLHAGRDRRTLFASTNLGLHRSDDDGRNWRHLPIDGPSPYLRAIVSAPGRDGTLFLCNGNGPPGSTGRLLRSDDLGERWREVPLPIKPNSTPWCIATSPSAPAVFFLCTNLGQIYRSTDGGERWTKLERELGEIRAAVLLPLH